MGREKMTLSELKDIIEKKYLHHGDFTLSSGAKSDKYFDIKGMLGNPKDMEELRKEISEEIHEYEMQHELGSLGGTELGGALLVSMLMITGMDDWRGCYIRKQQRIHGLKRMLEGQPRSPILLVDDVISTSLTTVMAMCECWESKLEVVGLLCVINRYGKDEISYNDVTIPIYSLFKESDFQ